MYLQPRFCAWISKREHEPFAPARCRFQVPKDSEPFVKGQAYGIIGSGPPDDAIMAGLFVRFFGVGAEQAIINDEYPAEILI